MYNKITIIGNLGSDPEMRYLPSGNAVTSFSVATNHRYNTRDGEQRDETEWFRVSAFGRLGEICNQYLSKGRQVYVEGRLRSRTWVDQQGQTRVSIEVNAQEVKFVGSRDGGGYGERGGGGAGERRGGYGSDGGYYGGDTGQGGGAPPDGPSDADDLPW